MSKFSDPFVDRLYDPLADPDAWSDLPPIPDRGPDPAAFETIASTLTPEQAKAAAHQGPILVLAGAGTGKTSTLTAAVVHRIAIDQIAPSRILAVTFTNKAAVEMTARIRAALGGQGAPSWLGTYHGLAARQLRDAPEIAGLRPGFDILDADDSRRLVKRTMKALNLASGEEGEVNARDPLKIMCNRLSKFKDNLMTPQGAAAWVAAKIGEAERTREAIDAAGLRAAVRVYADYQPRLREANAADFGDLLLWPTLAMQRNQNYRDRGASRFQWIHADEYQDVNFAQYCWLKAFASSHGRIFVVGDDDQSIYSWRGSDITFIRRFTTEFPNAIQVRLEENFRSTGHILSAANAVIAQDKKRLGKTLFTKKEQGAPIEIIGLRDAQAEAVAIITELQLRHAEGVGWDEIAILYRNNFLSRSFEEALMRAHIPHVLVGDVGFYQRAEIKDALALLRLAATPDDRQSDEAFRRVINEPRRGFGAKCAPLNGHPIVMAHLIFLTKMNSARTASAFTASVSPAKSTTGIPKPTPGHGAIEQIATREDLASLARSTQYAHYTPELLICAIWRAIERMGFAGGAILEPGCGSGLFFALTPEALADKISLTGVEADATTARIARLLYPSARIRHEDFTKARLPQTYNLIIGNPPFSDRTVRTGDPAGKLHLSLHDYFIARGVERLKPGGLAGFVTSRWTMDKLDQKARDHIASLADLVGAIRLPQGAMNAAAGTDVMVDMIFLQRRFPDDPRGQVLWDSLMEALPAEDGEAPLSINRYFIENPEMVLGRHARTSSPFGPAYSCLPGPGARLEALLAAAIDRLPQDICKAPSEQIQALLPAQPNLRVGTAAEGATIKEGSYILDNNELFQVIDGLPTPVLIRNGKGTEGIPAKHARIIRHLVPIRDAVRQVLRAQENDEPWGGVQVRLRVAYSSFVRNFGPINLTTFSETTDPETGETRQTQRRPNLAPFADDPDVWLVASIEDYDIETGKGKQGPIFTERVLHPPATPLIESASDALALTLHELGYIDLDRIAELFGRSRDETIAELGDRIYLDPQLTIDKIESWQTADAYLSGAVRTKLAAAIGAAALDPRYHRNVEALRQVQPEDLKPSDISARLGAPWIPPEDIAAFSAAIIGIETSIFHTPEIAAWTVDVRPFVGKAAATSEWGTDRRHAGLLLSDALNAAIPQIYDVFIEDGKEKRVLNAEDTEAAKEKLQKIKTAFERWVWTDHERADRLSRIYNDGFNNLVPRHFDGCHLQLPGASSVVKFYAHQLRIIYRIITTGQTYIAHTVGAGKTFSIAAAIKEQKRLGLISKAMLVVPGHCLAQASREFLILYPNARILVADETNFTKNKRERFLARAATATWDCIIITHSAFKLIPAPAEFERRFIQQQIDGYAELLDKVDSDDRISRKRIENIKEKLEAKFEALQSRKDDLLTIGEIGVDQIIVDEAQEYRKLSFPSNMTSLKGVDPDGSQRAWDLYVKSRFIAEKNPGRALVLASGTPITNTLGELFTVQRFMQPDILDARGIHQFDAWAATFGATRTELELQPSGLYKPVTRFTEFVNVPDLMAMYRMVADVVLNSDLRSNIRLPSIRGGRRQIVAADPSPAFKAYQRILAERITKIEERKGRPEKGEDIILKVIGDGRHSSIDMRFVLPDFEDEPANKLNALINNVHAIWQSSSDRRYTRPDGIPYALRGAAQMIFSDLGTLNAEATRGFSAYRWVKTRLVALGVPASQIAFMQNYKKSAAKQQLFADVNAGRIRVLIGSSDTMGTGVNAQRRLIALHHLDVPWLPAQITQREGRIERQGNENDEIEIYAYATKGSVDATGWQLLERKARFIDLAMSGDRSIRRLEDAGSQINQFAMAKAIASGDPRLMQKAGLEAELARLERMRAAHFDDQCAVRRAIHTAERTLASAETRIAQIEQDIAQRKPTRGDLFAMQVEGRSFAERKEAGAALLKAIRHREFEAKEGEWNLGAIGGFEITATASSQRGVKFALMELTLIRTGRGQDVEYQTDLTALGLVSRLEYYLSRFEVDLAEQKRAAKEAADRLPAYRQRDGEPFAYEAEHAEKLQELDEINAALSANNADGAQEAA